MIELFKVYSRCNADHMGWLALTVREVEWSDVELRLEISYATIRPFQAFVEKGHCDTWSATFNMNDNTVNLTNGAVFLDGMKGDDLKGCRIGTLLFDRIVEWAQRFPGASALPIRLYRGQANSENNLRRRNSLYKNHGVLIEFDSKAELEGSSTLTPVDKLHVRSTWKENIRPVCLGDLLSNLEAVKIRAEWLVMAARDYRSAINLSLLPSLLMLVSRRLKPRIASPNRQLMKRSAGPVANVGQHDALVIAGRLDCETERSARLFEWYLQEKAEYYKWVVSPIKTLAMRRPWALILPVMSIGLLVLGVCYW